MEEEIDTLVAMRIAATTIMMMITTTCRGIDLLEMVDTTPLRDADLLLAVHRGMKTAILTMSTMIRTRGDRGAAAASPRVEVAAARLRHTTSTVKAGVQIIIAATMMITIDTRAPLLLSVVGPMTATASVVAAGENVLARAPHLQPSPAAADTMTLAPHPLRAVVIMLILESIR
jgi:hypothetical protein